MALYGHVVKREKNRRTKIRTNWGECALIIPPRTLLKNNFTEYSVLRTYSKRHQQKVVNAKVPKVSAKVSLTNIKFPIFLQCNYTVQDVAVSFCFFHWTNHYYPFLSLNIFYVKDPGTMFFVNSTQSLKHICKFGLSCQIFSVKFILFQRDFRPPVFFINRTHLGPWPTDKIFSIFYEIAELFKF